MEMSLILPPSSDPEHTTKTLAKIGELQKRIAQMRQEPKKEEIPRRMSTSFCLDPKVEYSVNFELLDSSIDVMSKVVDAFKRKASPNEIIKLLDCYVELSQKTIVPKA